ncbi:MAG: aspartate/glutamate racemase family protein, partial [Gammaproteobacteria bacterium]|nr:aspartate/glutamate racemase family protein [Gammaproteobacteria bacterium]
INPNTTASMTEKIGLAARQAVRRETEILAVNPLKGPASIQGYHDVALCVPHLLDEISRHKHVDAIVIACFDDTGLDAARCAVEVPVVGIGEAAFHAASLLACKFSVVTTLRRSVPGIEANLLRYGLDRRCARVRACEVPVLELESNDPATLERIEAEIRLALEEDGAEAIVLGCSGMANLAKLLSNKCGVPVLEGVTCATAFIESLAVLGLKTSKIGGYAAPPSD